MTSSLNGLDIALIVIAFISIVIGLFRGLVQEVLSLTFLVAGLILAFLFYPQAGRMLSDLLPSAAMAMAAGFFIILILVLLFGALLSWLIRKVLVRGPLRALDRLLGALFGLLRGALTGALVVLLMISFARAVPKRGPQLQARNLVRHSLLAPPLLAALRWFSRLQTEAHARSILFRT
jgi:membrane protein required for colicin V production